MACAGALHDRDERCRVGRQELFLEDVTANAGITPATLLERPEQALLR